MCLLLHAQHAITHQCTHTHVCTHDNLSTLPLQGNDLVAEVFYNTSEHPLVDAINFNSYRVRAAAQTMSLHMGPSRTHATVVALSSSSGNSAGQQPGQQPWQSVRQQVGTPSYAPRLGISSSCSSVHLACCLCLCRAPHACLTAIPTLATICSCAACDTLHFDPFAALTHFL